MISKMTMFKVFLGSLFIQSSWSFEKMQGLGFAAALSPALSDLYRSNDAGRVGALKRHLAFYNAHPYIGSAILGATIRLEEKAASNECPADTGVVFKSRVMAPWSALGDSFVWGSIRPFASCLGILTAVLWGIWGPLVFLAVYNIFHIWMRWVWLKKGCEMGEAAVGYMKSLELARRGVKARYVSAAILGLTAVTATWRIMPYLLRGRLNRGVPDGRFGAAFIAASVLVIAAAPILSVFFKKGLTVSRLIYLVVLPLILYGILSY